jgi:hypothetical protein
MDGLKHSENPPTMITFRQHESFKGAWHEIFDLVSQNCFLYLVEMLGCYLHSNYDFCFPLRCRQVDIVANVSPFLLSVKN